MPRDFLPLVFFFKQLLLAPVDKISNDFDFFRIFAEIFDYFSASPVTTTQAMHALPVSLTLVNNSLLVSTTPVSDTLTVLERFTGVNDTGKKFLTGVIDTGKACIRRCQWHRRSMLQCHWHRWRHASPVSLIPDSKYCQLSRYQWRRRSMSSPVSMTPLMHQ